MVVTGSKVSQRPPKLAGSVLLGVALADALVGDEATEEDGGELATGFFALEQPVNASTSARAHSSR